MGTFLTHSPARWLPVIVFLPVIQTDLTLILCASGKEVRS